MLLNVGPTHDGRIMPIFEEILLQIGLNHWTAMYVAIIELADTFATGQWLEINGGCVYGSVPWIHQNDTVSSFVW